MRPPPKVLRKENVMNDNVKWLIIGSMIARCVAFVCVTYAAIAFGNARLLWWYIVPLLMSVSLKEEKDE